MAGRIALSDFGWRPLPCASAACAVLHQDPLLRGIPLGALGLLYGLVLASLVVASEVFGVRSLGLARSASYLGSLASVLLVARGEFIAGGYCPWCLLHAILCVSTALLLTLSVGDATRLRWVTASVTAVIGTLGGFAAIQLVQDSIVNRPGLSQGLAKVSRHELIADSVPLTSIVRSPEDRVKFIVFVELDCGVCLALLREVYDSPNAGLVRIRFMPYRGPEKLDATFLQLNIRNPDYVKAVRFIVEDNPSQAVIARYCHEFPGFVSPTDGPTGTGLATKLDVHASPTIVKLVGDRAVLSNDQELSAALGDSGG